MKTLLENGLAAFSCYNCGHPVPAEGHRLPRWLDVDATGLDRERCYDTTCMSDVVCVTLGHPPILVPAG